MNENIIKRIIELLGITCSSARDRYIEIQDDSPEEWSLSNTLTYLGLGGLNFNKKQIPRTIDEETAKRRFAQLYVHLCSPILPSF